LGALKRCRTPRYARKRQRTARVDLPDPGAGIWAAKDPDVEHPGQADVLGVPGAPGDPLRAVDPAGALPDGGQRRVIRIGGEVRAIDERQLLGDHALEFDAVTNDAAGHERSFFAAASPAATMFG